MDDVVDAAEHRAVAVVRAYWRAIGEPGDRPLVVDDCDTIHAVLDRSNSDYSRGYQ